MTRSWLFVWVTPTYKGWSWSSCKYTVVCFLLLIKNWTYTTIIFIEIRYSIKNITWIHGTVLYLHRYQNSHCTSLDIRKKRKKHQMTAHTHIIQVKRTANFLYAIPCNAIHFFLSGNPICKCIPVPVCKQVVMHFDWFPMFKLLGSVDHAEQP